MNFRKTAEMFVAIPRRQLAVFTDLTARKRDWSKLDEPAEARAKVNIAKWRTGIARRKRQAS